MAISLQGVSLVVPGPDGPLRVLDEVTLELTQQRVGIIGDNGSGKSSLLRLIDGLIMPSAGQLRVNGMDPVTNGKTVRRDVGFVFTDAMAQLLAPTVIEDIELSLRAAIKDKNRRSAKALELLDDWGLAQLARRSVYDISGGERQLVALISVLAVEPKIILADEPTTLLDLTNRLRLRAAFARLPQQVVIATHDLELAAELERVLVLDQGRVVFDGGAAEAIARYCELAAANPQIEAKPEVPVRHQGPENIKVSVEPKVGANG